LGFSSIAFASSGRAFSGSLAYLAETGTPQVENVVHGMGMALLLIFMLYVNVMDFVNPISVNIP
jgi:hypothetical protein